MFKNALTNKYGQSAREDYLCGELASFGPENIVRWGNSETSGDYRAFGDGAA